MEEPAEKGIPRNTKRIPPEETVDLYPGLCVCDDRVSGSITVSPSRLPLWTFVGILVVDGWDAVVRGWDYIETEYGWTKYHMSDFLYHILESRGEFGRLLLLIANVERQACSNSDSPWYNKKDLRQRVREQLQRCIAVLDRMEGTVTFPNGKGTR